MASTYPVAVYGANGYTGRLIMEYLRDYGLPFVAVGRDEGRLKEAVRSVPGLETVDHQVRATAGDADALADAFDGCTVVCNTVGPFQRYAAPVAEATLRAGAHYIDTTGEQGWILEGKEAYADRYAQAGLLFAPSTAYMYISSDLTAQVALERDPSVDTLDILGVLNGVPTYASTQSIFDLLRKPFYYLEDDAFAEWPKTQAYEVVSPGFQQTVLAAPWGGAAQPVWYADDPRVSTCRVLIGWPNRGLVQGVIAMAKQVEEELAGLGEDERITALTAKAESIQGGTPPRENVRVNRTVESCIARGNTGVTRVALFGTCAYKQTGVIQAVVARALVQAPPPRVGFASVNQVYGYRMILSALQSYGLVGEPIVS